MFVVEVLPSSVGDGYSANYKLHWLVSGPKQPYDPPNNGPFPDTHKVTHTHTPTHTTIDQPSSNMLPTANSHPRLSVSNAHNRRWSASNPQRQSVSITMGHSYLGASVANTRSVNPAGSEWRGEVSHRAASQVAQEKEALIKEKKAAPKKKNSQKPPCCTVPIAVLFVFACVVIAGVFTTITSISSVAYHKEVESRIAESLALALENAMNVFVGPLSQSATWARGMKSMIESSPDRYGCDDTITTSFPGNSTNYGFFYEAGMLALQRPTLQYIYLSRLSTRFLEADGITGRPVVCLVAPRQNEMDLFFNYSHLSAHYGDDGMALENMRSLTYTSSPNVDISGLEVVSGPTHTNGSRWVASPILLQTGANVTIINPASNVGRILTKFSFLIEVAATPSGGSKFGLGIDHSMKDVRTLLTQATPPISIEPDLNNASAESLIVTPGAHTTLYDLANHVVLSCTRNDVPTTNPSGELYAAGHTPDTEVNAAYRRALDICAKENCVNHVVVTLPGSSSSSSVVHTVYIVSQPRNHLELMLVQSVPRAFYFAESDRVFALDLGLSVGSCCGVVIGCVVLLLLIQRPLSSLQDNMILAAELHNDRVENTFTYLRDIARLSEVFNMMNQQLLVARSFVPEAVLLGKTEDSQEGKGDDDDECEEGSVSRMSYSNINKVTGFADASVAKNSVVSGSQISSTASSGMAKLFNVNEKRIAVLSLNLVGFHAMCGPERRVGRAQKIDELTTALLTLVLACSHAERGVMDSFHGDHFILTFNASRAVAGSLVAAVRTANAFISAVYDSSEFTGCKGVAAGAAVGRASVGTFGIDGYRRMSVIGEVYRNANALQHAAVQFLRMNGRHLLRDGGCLVDEPTSRELGSCAVHLQLAGCIQSSTHRATNSAASPSTNPVKVYFAHAVNSEEANAEAKLADGEWLYELDAIESTNPYVDPNRALVALMNGDTKQCSELLAAGKAATNQQSESPQASPVANQFLQASSRGATRNKSVASIDFGAASLSLNGGSVSLLQQQPASPWDLIEKHLTEANTQTEILTRLYNSEQKGGGVTAGAVASFTSRLSAPWLAFQQ